MRCLQHLLNKAAKVPRSLRFAKVASDVKRFVSKPVSLGTGFYIK